MYIGRLVNAFYDRDYGIEDPIFVLKKSRRTQDPTVKVHGRMWVALAYECLRKAGKSHPTIGEEIAKHSHLKTLLRGKNASLKTSPKSWHDEFMYKEITNSSIQYAFKQMYQNLKLGDNLQSNKYLELSLFCLWRASQIARSVS